MLKFYIAELHLNWKLPHVLERNVLDQYVWCFDEDRLSTLLVALPDDEFQKYAKPYVWGGLCKQAAPLIPRLRTLVADEATVVDSISASIQVSSLCNKVPGMLKYYGPNEVEVDRLVALALTSPLEVTKERLERYDATKFVQPPTLPMIHRLVSFGGSYAQNALDLIATCLGADVAIKWRNSVDHEGRDYIAWQVKLAKIDKPIKVEIKTNR